MSFKESLGFGEKFNPLILIQVIVVILGFLTVLENIVFYGAITFDNIFTILWSIYTIFLLLAFISLLVYSFYGYNKGDCWFKLAIIFLILNTIVTLVVYTYDGMGLTMMEFIIPEVVILLLLIFFYWKLNDPSKAALIAICLVFVVWLIELLPALAMGNVLILVLEQLLIPLSFILTYVARIG